MIEVAVGMSRYLRAKYYRTWSQKYRENEGAEGF